MQDTMFIALLSPSPFEQISSELGKEEEVSGTFRAGYVWLGLLFNSMGTTSHQ